ncbi:uncharacterized protein LOC130725603 [Lotus japonicus]|uniref:uncharacterized protein LOC130725603 n=1 Tax=Lotus japonicus TaxID=34305 RepID=UPI0025905B0A|nr:uncharacterized protein LOC130725603 [Lotus japonicus]
MAAMVEQMVAIVCMLGGVSHIMAVVSVRKKLTVETPVPGDDGGTVTCEYPTVQSVVFGYLSVAFLIACTMFGYIFVFYPYKGKSVPQRVMLKHTSFTICFYIAFFTFGLTANLLLWTTIRDQAHLTNNVHSDLICKTDTLGVGSIFSVYSTMLWLAALMYADNARGMF